MSTNRQLNTAHLKRIQLKQNKHPKSDKTADQIVTFMVRWVNKPVKDFLSSKDLYFEPMANGIDFISLHGEHINKTTHIKEDINKTLKKKNIQELD